MISYDYLARKQNIGVDVDGILCNFTAGYLKLLGNLTNKRPVDPETFNPQMWHFEKSLGFTQAEVDAAWRYIKVDPVFWRSLSPLPGIANFLDALKRSGHDIYFATARPGLTAKRQTEAWLRPFFENATVLLTGYKGLVAKALSFDSYIDDRVENCVDVASMGTRVYMLRTGYNRVTDAEMTDTRVTQVQSIYEMLDAEAIPYDGARTLATAA